MTAPEIRSANDDVPWRRRRACWWMKNLGSRIALQWYCFCPSNICLDAPERRRQHCHYDAEQHISRGSPTSGCPAEQAAECVSGSERSFPLEGKQVDRRIGGNAEEGVLMGQPLTKMWSSS